MTPLNHQITFPSLEKVSEGIKERRETAFPVLSKEWNFLFYRLEESQEEDKNYVTIKARKERHPDYQLRKFANLCLCCWLLFFFLILIQEINAYRKSEEMCSWNFLEPEQPVPSSDLILLFTSLRGLREQGAQLVHTNIKL